MESFISLLINLIKLCFIGSACACFIYVYFGKVEYLFIYLLIFWNSKLLQKLLNSPKFENLLLKANILQSILRWHCMLKC